MLTRFAAAAVVASIATAIAAVFVLMLPNLTLQQMSPILVIWCMAPCIWGLWAVIAPSEWVQQRLPIWGAVLGIIVGILALFVLNMPYRVFGLSLSHSMRALGTVFATLMYYLLWMAVSFTYRKFSRPSAPMKA
ncbi:MAG: hypothetical protein ROO76_18520 [Terriglobia bacterium]|jgi:hypothetical protein|nr:hypothetical protein [Terriglobia bacterium]